MEEKINRLQQDVDYIKSMLEDLTLTLASGHDNRAAVAGQMDILKKMFTGLPGINPETQQRLGEIFDQAGGIQ